MDILFKEILELTTSQLITPKNLVDNAYLSHYNYVKYSANQGNMVVEMEITNEVNETELYTYYFDENEYLQTITLVYRDIKMTIFDRLKELSNKRSEYLNLDVVNL